MKVRYSPRFYQIYKKANVRIRNSVDQKIEIFIKNPHEPQLDNHELDKEWEGYRSIDITGDLRAIYQEIEEGDEMVAYFISLGTHEELY